MATAAQKRIKSVSYAKYGYFFTLPFFLVYFVFSLYPLIKTFILAFYGNGDSAALDEAGTSINCFVGLDNFKTLLIGGDNRSARVAHEDFFRYFGNTLIIWIGNFIPQIALSLLLAVWFTDLRVKIPGKEFFKVVMYLPNIITAASVAALFLSLFGNSSGSVINVLRAQINPDAQPLTLATDPVWSKVIVMFIQVWMWFGNTMIMLMAGIQGINESLFEAAEIDGASPTQTFWRITLPLLRSIMVYTLLTSMIGGLQMFDIPYLFHSGTSQNENIATVAVFIYRRFHDDYMNPSYGQSAAASVILFFITSILGALVFWVQRDKDAMANNKKKRAAAKEAKRRAAQGGGFSI